MLTFSPPELNRRKSLMDFPAEIATLNRRLRISRMRSKRSSDCDVSVPVTLPIDRGRIEELKGL